MLAEHIARDPERSVRLRQRAVGAWLLLESGLLHQVCALKLQEIADIAGTCVSASHRRTRQHMEAIRLDAGYAETASVIAHEAVARDLPPPARVLDLPRSTPLDAELLRLREGRE